MMSKHIRLNCGDKGNEKCGSRYGCSATSKRALVSDRSCGCISRRAFRSGGRLRLDNHRRRVCGTNGAICSAVFAAYEAAHCGGSALALMHREGPGNRPAQRSSDAPRRAYYFCSLASCVRRSCVMSDELIVKMRFYFLWNANCYHFVDALNLLRPAPWVSRTGARRGSSALAVGNDLGLLLIAPVILLDGVRFDERRQDDRSFALHRDH
jgi:hypothetical protein